jgi:protein TonB
VVQPKEIPQEIPKASTGSGGVEGGVEGGIEGGEMGGVVGGIVGGVPGPTPIPVVEEAPIRVGGDVLPPAKVREIQPIYPEIARKARIQGPVILEAVIDKEGNVTAVRALRGLPMGCTEAAIDALQRTKFKPATMNGRPVAVYYVLTVVFKLD